jgi:hypothetical protein
MPLTAGTLTGFDIIVHGKALVTLISDPDSLLASLPDGS